MATINVNAGKNDVINVNVNNESIQVENEQEKDEQEKINTMHDTLRSMLNKYNNKRYATEHKAWWYEVFCDFSEDFDNAIYPIIKDMEVYQAYTYCLGYMYMRDSYYNSPAWINDLNNMLKNCNFK
jgi:hypothetical protein